MTGTFNETFFAFDAEVERLDEAIDEIDDELADVDPDSQRAAALSNQRQQLKSQRQGVVWARDVAPESDDFDAWDEAVDGVTLGGLRAGVYGRLQDDLSGDDSAGRGSARTLYVADGTAEAPYVDDDMTDRERTAAVKDLHPFYNMWAEDRINRLMDPEGNVASSGHSPGATNDGQDDD